VDRAQNEAVGYSILIIADHAYALFWFCADLDLFLCGYGDHRSMAVGQGDARMNGRMRV
jgi:hypothetical protein